MTVAQVRHLNASSTPQSPPSRRQQTSDQPTLKITLTPLEPNKFPPAHHDRNGELDTWSTSTGSTQPQNKVALPQLCLCPGEITTLQVDLDNSHHFPGYQICLMSDALSGELQHNKIKYEIYQDIQASTHFYTDSPEHPPTKQLKVAHLPQQFFVRFFAESDFFEDPLLRSNQGESPSLNYSINLLIYTLTKVGEPQHLIASHAFELFVRPRTRYLEFLPGVYQERKFVGDFINRFLKIFEQAFDPTVQTIDNLWAYLDPLTAPRGMLPFLAEWVSWHNETDWPIEKQRQLIHQAIELYRCRGTKHGLKRYLHYYTNLPEANIKIDDKPYTGFTLNDSGVELPPSNQWSEYGYTPAITSSGTNVAILGAGQAFHFTVTLIVDRPNQYLDRQLIESIINETKPAFCTYELIITRLETELANTEPAGLITNPEDSSYD
ncbi:hypothetical protein IQ266_21910 [filamentous cyanobacterium LEGE 11480]|uniref:Phage tail protein n=1 Tax=Romeriopsis navalis LEGE 11480 TaxID=2777977 RepID=A0A928VPI1_9CYAN|nr:phage tail protein [Romeriopsis navalis]MBE9032398.1 hypothetical protein [Romeriopsis navalis LEGE 11480]